MPKRSIVACLLLTMSLQLVACSSSRTIVFDDPGEPRRPDVSVGDDVKVVTLDGRHHNGRVVAVTEQDLTISRSHYRDEVITTIAFADIETVEVKEGTTVLGIVAGAGLGVALLSLGVLLVVFSGMGNLS